MRERAGTPTCFGVTLLVSSLTHEKRYIFRRSVRCEVRELRALIVILMNPELREFHTQVNLRFMTTFKRQ
jgi:hypothetical protein